MKSFNKLKTKLSELFQLDQADLDFGIYRIMNDRQYSPFTSDCVSAQSPFRFPASKTPAQGPTSVIYSP